MGILYGVSVGAGDPELITLKAIRIIESCKVIAVPRTKQKNTLALNIVRQILDLSEKKILYLDFPMSKNPEILDRNYFQTAELICQELRTQDIAFLCLGDIGIYSTFAQIAERVQKQGFEIRRCPGVPSFCAAAAEMNQSLVNQGETLEILPYDCECFSEKLDSPGNKIIMKAGSHALELKDKLPNGWAVSDCGLENQQIFSDLHEIQENLSYFTLFYTKL